MVSWKGIHAIVFGAAALGFVIFYEFNRSQQNHIRDVSIMQLLAEPDDYDETTIRVSGYLHIEFESSALYLIEEHAAYLMNRDSLWVSFSDECKVEVLDANGFSIPGEIKSVNDRYVIVEGVFDANMHGHMNGFSAGIGHIMRVSEQKCYR